ncbi:hypothetical protein ACLOJK_002323 [Asimina triloba]
MLVAQPIQEPSLSMTNPEPNRAELARVRLFHSRDSELSPIKSDGQRQRSRWPYPAQRSKISGLDSCYRWACLSPSLSVAMSLPLGAKASVACKKVASFGESMFGRSFNSSKCKTVARLATSRIKLLRNKREMQVKQMRRDVALLLQSGQEATARIRVSISSLFSCIPKTFTVATSGRASFFIISLYRGDGMFKRDVEHVIREQNIMAANEIIELFCELIVARLSIIAKQRECPADLKEGISSLIFSAPRCSDIPELQQIRKIFEKKYGKDFVSAATELRPDCGVNRTAAICHIKVRLNVVSSVSMPSNHFRRHPTDIFMFQQAAISHLIEKLSVRAPTGEIKLKVMKEIAKEYQIKWDTAESEQELLKPPEELLEGPRAFVSASSMSVKTLPPHVVQQNGAAKRSSSSKESQTTHFKDSASAAQAAAESAEKAVAAAQAAAYLANQTPKVNSFGASVSGGNCTQFSIPKDPFVIKTSQKPQNSLQDDLSTLPRREDGSWNSDRSQDVRSEEPDLTSLDNKIPRRQSHNAPVVHSDIKFDDSDGLDTDTDEEIEMEAPPSGSVHVPPNRPPPSPPQGNELKDYDTMGASNLGFSKQNSLFRIHPKLPDYDTLAARFEALKYRR